MARKLSSGFVAKKAEDGTSIRSTPNDGKNEFKEIEDVRRITDKKMRGAIINHHNHKNLANKESLWFYWFDLDGVECKALNYKIPIGKRTFFFQDLSDEENGLQYFRFIQLYRFQSLLINVSTHDFKKLTEKKIYRTFDPNNPPQEMLEHSTKLLDYVPSKLEYQPFEKVSMSMSEYVSNISDLREVIAKFELMEDNQKPQQWSHKFIVNFIKANVIFDAEIKIEDIILY